MAERPPTSRPEPRDTPYSHLPTEVRLALVEQRLNDGNKAFTKLEVALERVEAATAPPKPPQRALLPVVMAIVTVVALVGSWVWQIARYPDRVEFERAAAVVDSRLEKVADQNRALALELTRLQTQLEERSRAAAAAAAAAATALRKGRTEK